MSSTNNSTLTSTTVEKERIWNRYVGYFFTLHGVCVITCIAIDSIHLDRIDPLTSWWISQCIQIICSLMYQVVSPLKVCDMASSTWQFYESKFLVPPYSGPVTRITFQLLIESCTSIFVGYQDCSQPPIFMHPLYIGIKMSVCLYIRNRQKLMMCIYCCGSLVVYSSRTAMALCMPLMSQQFGWDKKQQVRKPHINVA